MRPNDKDSKAQSKVRKAYEEAVLRAFRAYMETKEQADINYKLQESTGISH